MIRKYARAAFVASLMMSATGVATAMLATTAVVQAADKVGKAVGVPLNDAVKAMQVNDWQAAMAKVKEADAVANKNGYEQYNINKFYGIIYLNLNDHSSATTVYEAAADSPSMPADEKKDVLSNALQLSQEAKHYQKAIDYGKQLESMNALNDLLTAQVALAYYQLNDMTNAQSYAQKSVDLSKAANKAPNEIAMQIIMKGQAKNNDPAAAIHTLEQLAVDYNASDSWQQLTGVALGVKGVQTLDALYIFRLRYTAGAMKDADDYEVYGSLCNQLGYPMEAKTVIEQGVSSGKAKAGATLSKARTDAAGDQRAMNQFIASAKASKSGEQDVKLAEDLYGYGRYTEAEEAARRGIGKDGVKDANEGQMILGVVLLAQNKYDDAVAAFGQVGGSEARKNAAHIWSLYAQAKKKQSSASTAPAH
ncbi:MAG: hypothetical protein HY243_04530 [Proteobacteria bacterium]|nr:hypothetical protein [Pseudomonadota bacterium]